MPATARRDAKPMASEKMTNPKEFIVVGGRRRWFSVLDKDERFNGLQRRVTQERELAIPEQPPEVR